MRRLSRVCATRARSAAAVDDTRVLDVDLDVVEGRFRKKAQRARFPPEAFVDAKVAPVVHGPPSLFFLEGLEKRMRTNHTIIISDGSRRPPASCIEGRRRRYAVAGAFCLCTFWLLLWPGKTLAFGLMYRMTRGGIFRILLPSNSEIPAACLTVTTAPAEEPVTAKRQERPHRK
jgi:hypothetical protein